MVKTVIQLVLVVLVGVITSSAAFAKEMKKEVTFSNPVVVNGTPVKAGTYNVVFDDQTNELSIVKDRKVIAKAPARFEKREETDQASYVTREEEGDSSKSILVSVVFKDNNQATIVSNGDAAQ